MLFDLIGRAFRGEVQSHYIGSDAAVFCNRVQDTGICLRQIKPTDRGVMIWLPAAQYKLLRPICRSCQGHLRIQKKRGLPFSMKGFRHRLGLVVGMACFFVLLWHFSSLVWVVEVQGNNTVSTDRILQVLESVGIAPGRVVKDPSFSYLEQEALVQLPQLAWLAINRTGSRIVVDVTELTPRETPIDIKKAAHLVADCDGQIISIETYSGTPKLQPGQAFTKGDILISAHLQGQNTAYSATAMGKVTARVEQTFAVHLPVRQTAVLPTGKIKRQYRLRIFGATIPLTGQKQPFKEAQKLEGQRRLTLFGMRLPFSLETTLWRETKTQSYLASKEALRMQANLLLSKQLRRQLDQKELVALLLEDGADADGYRLVAKAVFVQQVGVLQPTSEPATPLSPEGTA